MSPVCDDIGILSPMIVSIFICSVDDAVVADAALGVGGPNAGVCDTCEE